MNSARGLRLLLCCLFMVAGCTNATPDAGTALSSELDTTPDELAFINDVEPALSLAVRGVGLAEARNALGELEESDGVGVEADLSSVFDPLQVNPRDQSSVVVSDLLFDGLTEAVGRSRVLRPALALDWSANSNSTNWAFLLDTDRITAGQVKASFERLVRSGGLPSVLLDDVIGTDLVRAGLSDTVEGFEAVDDETFVIHLERPNAGLAWVLSGLAMSVVGDDSAPTGLYSISDRSGSDRWILEADAGEGGAVELIWLDGVPSGSTDEATDPADETVDEAGGQDGDVLDLDGRDLVESGLADIAWADALSEGALAGDETALSGESVPLGSVRMLVLNSASETFRDALVRETVVAGIDAASLSNGGAIGGVERADLFGHLGSSALAGFESRECSWCDVSDERAAELAQVVPTVESLIVGYLEGAGEVDATLLVEQLRSAGFGATAVQYSPQQLAEGVADGSVDIFEFAWTAPSGSLDGTIELLLGSWSRTNVLGIGWAEVDALINRAALTAADDERWSLLAEAERLALSQLVAVPFDSGTNELVGGEAVDGLVVRADGSIDIDGIA